MKRPISNSGEFGSPVHLSSIVAVRVIGRFSFVPRQLIRERARPISESTLTLTRALSVVFAGSTTR